MYLDLKKKKKILENTSGAWQVDIVPGNMLQEQRVQDTA